MTKSRRDGDDEAVAFHACGLGDEEVAFHAHYGGDEEVAVHVRHANSDRAPARMASTDLDEATTTPRRTFAEREIAQFVSMLDSEQAARELDISRTPTTSRRHA